MDFVVIKAIVMKIILADSAVSLVPETWYSDPKIASYIRKYDRHPLINGTDHQHLLRQVPLEDRKDRPDILHFGLLTVLGYHQLIPEVSIMFQVGQTYYELSATTRLPRSQKRFYGILEQLLISDNNPMISKQSPPTLPVDQTIYFSQQGRSLRSDDLEKENFVFGAFAHGHFKTHTPTEDQLVSLSPHHLDLWTALSLFLNHF